MGLFYSNRMNKNVERTFPTKKRPNSSKHQSPIRQKIYWSPCLFLLRIITDENFEDLGQIYKIILVGVCIIPQKITLIDFQNYVIFFRKCH